MNANSYNIDIVVECGQVEETVKSLFHTILLHRTTGKFHYKHEGTYSIGTVGTEDIDCDYIDFTYVRVASETMSKIVAEHAALFCEQLQKNAGVDCAMGTITLEFYQKRRSRWPFNDESVPWEMWNLHITERMLQSEAERTIARETAGARLCEKVTSIVEAVGRYDFVPKMPTQSDLLLVFETSMPDVQPYLFKIRHNFGDVGYTNTPDSKASNVGFTVRRLFRDTLT